MRRLLLAVALTCLAGHVEQVTCYGTLTADCHEPNPCHVVRWSGRATNPAVCRTADDQCVDFFYDRDLGEHVVNAPNTFCISECVKP